jgi:nitroimidazol reductase NimA-like FMN-containing flavoprotein (pyridoxamine 5'-phosphate oxidase superfamily)
MSTSTPGGAARAATPAAPASRPDDAAARPTFRVLLPEECEALLRRGRVGRLAFVLRGQVGIVPVHYAYADGWLYGRTAPGEKLAALRAHPWVAFEVDEVEGTFDWRSVVVRGAFYRLAREGPHTDRVRWQRAVAAVRTVVPEAFGPGDPTPERDVLFRIHAGEVSGRAAHPAAARPPAP